MTGGREQEKQRGACARCLLESSLFISTEASLKEQKQQFFQLFLSVSDKISLSAKGK